MLDRDTMWRQGSIFHTSDAQAIGLVENEGEVAIMVSHDCDIPHPAEIEVEVIVGKLCTRDKMFANSRNPRKLHLTYLKNGDEVTIELFQLYKQSIEKSRFEVIGQPDESYILCDEQKRSLKQWLAARYGRPAYPNSFENRLTSCDKGKFRLEKEVAKILSDKSDHIIAVFFDLDEGRNVELPDEEPYILRIVVAYDAIDGGTDARVSSEEAAESIKALFHSCFGPPEEATTIILDSCTAVADINLPLSDIRKMDQWRLEYVSIQDDPQSPFLAAGS